MNILNRVLIAVTLIVLAPVSAHAATFTVTNTTDGGAGSLRQAILNANVSPDLDTIAFNIPGAGPHTIQPLLALPTITEPVIIDGYTEPGASPNTNGPGLGSNAVLKIELDGSNAGAGASGLHITGGSTTIKGLVINRFGAGFFAAGINVEGNGGNAIEGNFIGTDATGTATLGNSGAGVRIATSSNNTIGDTSPAARNIISANGFNGVFITGVGATGNVVQGNFIGTDLTGTIALGNSFEGVSIVNAPNNAVGGTNAGARNVISGNQNGIAIGGAPATGNVVQGNFIGTDLTGTIVLGNSRVGVFILSSSNVIGGTTPEAGNVISGNGSDGVIIRGVFLTGDPVPGGATGNLVQGNFIGTDVGGTAVLSNGHNGVFVIAASDNTIGGMAAGAGNTVAFNGGDGVFVSTCCELSGTGNAILSNAIFSNTGLGIDLDPDGVTPNDAGDGDAGGNNLQNFPVLTSALTTHGRLVVRGGIDIPIPETVTIEFFANPVPTPGGDPSGHGEGAVFLGRTSPTPQGQIFAVLPVVELRTLISATATDADGNTSEFAANIEATAPGR
jgi:titin